LLSHYVKVLVVLQEIFTLSIDFCRTFAMHMTCPSVRPSQADIDSKLITVGSCSFHRRAAKRSRFLSAHFTPFYTLSAHFTEEQPLRGLQTRLWCIKTEKKTHIFDQ